MVVFCFVQASLPFPIFFFIVYASFSLMIHKLAFFWDFFT